MFQREPGGERVERGIRGEPPGGPVDRAEQSAGAEGHAGKCGRDGRLRPADLRGAAPYADRGAIEAHYETSKYSDVLLTPDLRILISGPGDADLSIRVSRQGDTCIDNRGPKAPYITVTSPLEGGLYRVQPGQHVSFQHGSLREVVDTEHEPCGCPAPLSMANAGTPAPIGAPSAPNGVAPALTGTAPAPAGSVQAHSLGSRDEHVDTGGDCLARRRARW